MFDTKFMKTGLTLLLGCTLAGFGLVACQTAKPSAPPALKITHVDPAGAAKAIQEKKIVVVDVRTPEEFKGGHLGGAKSIDFTAADFEKKLSALNRDQEYLIYCRSGRRSTGALETFKKLGFKSVTHLDGGYQAWTAASKPVEK